MNGKPTLGEEKMTFSELVSARIISLLEKLNEGIAKLYDFYTTREREDTIAEVYNIETTTQEDTIHAPMFDIKGERVRMHWFWLQIENFDDTDDVWIGINGDSDSGIKVEAGKTKTINYNNLKIDYIRYKADSATPKIQLICLRPRYHGR